MRNEGPLKSCQALNEWLTAFDVLSQFMNRNEVPTLTLSLTINQGFSCHSICLSKFHSRRGFYTLVLASVFVFSLCLCSSLCLLRLRLCLHLCLCLFAFLFLLCLCIDLCLCLFAFVFSPLSLRLSLCSFFGPVFFFAWVGVFAFVFVL